MTRTGMIFPLVGLLLAVAPAASAQQAAAEDVSSADAIVSALYAVISGDAGVPRNWDRMRSLFHPEARLIPVGRAADGTYRVRVMTLAQWIEGAEPYFAREGFHERELAQRTESFGQMVHRFSTYDSRRSAGAAPFARGINSIQLFNDGTRWWVMNIMWDAERPGLVIPDHYLESR